MSSREITFDQAYAIANGPRFVELDDFRAGWDAGERQALERAIQALDESGARPMDIDAIRALMDQDASSEKEGS